MSWKNHVVETDSGANYRIQGHKVRNIIGTVAEFQVHCMKTLLTVGVIDSRWSQGGRGADVVRFYGFAFNGLESVSRSLSEAVDNIVSEFERGSTDIHSGLLDLIT